MSENKHTIQDLMEMQSWSLESKIQATQAKILEWYSKNNKMCYIAFSGGKDSTVLADITARVCASLKCKLVLWFSNTGLEYPELRQHVNFFENWVREKYKIAVDLYIDYPKYKHMGRVSFRDIILKEGYPIISKEVASNVHKARSCPTGVSMQRFIEDSPVNIKYPRYKLTKYKYLLDAPFKISSKCCDIMKKNPAKRFENSYKLKPIIGTMACESMLRRNDWLKHGCNAFDTTRPISKPLSFWTEQDVLQYIKSFNIPYPSVYGDIIGGGNGKLITTGCSRTGCIFCGFGCHLEKEPNRFQRLKITHPELYEYCMKPVESGGLGMKEILEYINVSV